jgi:hypothetical protein
LSKINFKKYSDMRLNPALFLVLILTVNGLNAQKLNKKSTDRNPEGCEPGRASTELAINNVRALIHTAGDMWWDLQGKAVYEVPAGSGINSIFAGAIWIGGKDANDQIKVAAMRFRQRGHDYWPGPLIAEGGEIASVSKQVCRDYDKHFVIYRDQVTEFREWLACKNDDNCNESEIFGAYTIPDIILNWPAHGPPGGYSYHLAPFWDEDGDGVYNPMKGDFPYFEYPENGKTDDYDCLRPRGRQNKLHGDKTLWWVFNDAGNIKSETGSEHIGLEIRAQAFGFSTNDEFDNMTFYNYHFINRSTNILNEGFVGIFADPDLGNPTDDYAGCDVLRGLGYVYNGDDYDEDYSGMHGYGHNPPAVGIAFLEGPYKDPNGIDDPSSYEIIDGERVLNCSLGDILNGNINGMNFGDEIVDNERWGMTRFMYHNGAGQGVHPATTYPAQTKDYYNYLRGHWKDDSPLSYGGTGHISGGGDPNTPAYFMWPGNSDPCGFGTQGNPMPDWSEETENNPPDDRRFTISSGPFTLLPGESNEITVGAIWARATSGGPYASVEALKRSTDKAQALFDNCFRIIEGPDAPDIHIVELHKKLIFHISNKAISNNHHEQYNVKDYYLICDDDETCDEYYRFQGYQVFQLKHQNVDFESERYNSDLVKQVFQCDLKDGTGTIINYIRDNKNNIDIPVIEVEGDDDGIRHSFVITQDAFADENSSLINFKEYYFTVIAYAYNDSPKYNPGDSESFNNPKSPYLSGKNNIKTYIAVPHVHHPDGTVVHTEYGQALKVTQIEGFGNADNRLELTKESIDEIMKGYPWRANEVEYENGYGPINVKIIDPLNVVADTYELKFIEPLVNPRGVVGVTHQELSERRFVPFDYIIINSAGDTVNSEGQIRYYNGYELILPNWGISVNIYQSGFSGHQERNENENNGFLYASMEFDDPGKDWLMFLPDATSLDAYNWIRVGNFRNRAGEIEDPCGAFMGYNDYIAYDRDRHFANILGGTWAPYHLTSTFKYGPAHSRPRGKQNLELEQFLSSIDLVITSDTSLWTRSVVVEMCENEWEIRETNNSGTPCLNSPFPHWREVSPAINYRSEGNALKFSLRKSPSVSKDGLPDGAIDENGDPVYGMGWFPGYAIDVRTGERLNIVFGEDSWLVGANGNDMIWNPSSELENLNGPVFGGKHYIYIMGRTHGIINPQSSSPIYDSCSYIYQKLRTFDQTGTWSRFDEAWMGAMWTAIPLLKPEHTLMETDVRIKLRVGTPYMQAKHEQAKDNPQNDNLPYYRFSTDKYETIFDDKQIAEKALDLIRVVPNPYYGNNMYSIDAFDHYVKIINLPQRCVINIYNINGTLIRRFDKDDSSPFLQWDLTNSHGNMIAGGAYIIHINSAEYGDKIIKWFGAINITE